jgi:CRP-like cAMP-binding protein
LAAHRAERERTTEKEPAMARSEIEQVLQSIPLFSKCSKKEIKAIGALMTLSNVEAGYPLATEGEIGREFIVIEEGDAVVHRNGKEIGTLGAGNSFGELAMLVAGKRTASVTAQTDMSIWIAGPGEFSALLWAHPSIMYNVLMAAVTRLYDDNTRDVQ